MPPWCSFAANADPKVILIVLAQIGQKVLTVIAYCREMFQYDLPSAILKKRAEKFDSALLN